MLVYIPNIFRFQIESLRNSPFPLLGEDQNKVQHLIILLFCFFLESAEFKTVACFVGFCLFDSFVCLIDSFVCLFIYFLNPFDPLRVKFSRSHLLDWRVNSASNWLKKCCRHARRPNFPAVSELLNLYYKCLGKVKMKQMSIHILFFILILFLKGPFLKRQNRLNNIFFLFGTINGKKYRKSTSICYAPRCRFSIQIFCWWAY